MIFAVFDVLSRASAVALSTVLRTTSLSYGNTQTSGTHRTETPGPIMMKLCTLDYVAPKTLSAKIGEDRLAGGFSTNG